MRIKDLRSLALFDGVTDEQLAGLAEGGTEIRVQPGLELFREGEHADFWWVLLEGVIDLVRHVGPEETVVAKMDVPGRWAGGFRAWDEQGVYLATGRAATAGRVLQVPAEVLREWFNTWLPLGGRLIEGLYRTARSIEATARQRESLAALGTLAAGLAHEINNPAAATVRAVDALEDACQTLLASLSQLAGHQISAQQFTALDMLRGEVTTRAVAPDALALADQEETLASWLTRHDVADEWTIAASLAPGQIGPGCGDGAGGAGAGARPAVGGEHALCRHAAVRDQGIESAHLGPGRRRQVVLADGPRFYAAHKCDRRP